MPATRSGVVVRLSFAAPADVQPPAAGFVVVDFEPSNDIAQSCLANWPSLCEVVKLVHTQCCGHAQAQLLALLYAGDTQHFDLSYSAFGALADHNAGVIDLQYERVPLVMCRTPDQAVNTGTCNKYWGVLVSADVWKLFVGVGICMAIAGISGFVFVKSVYGFRTPRPFAANAA